MKQTTEIDPSEIFEEGKWYGWNGGPRPVCAATRVDIVISDPVFELRRGVVADRYDWGSPIYPIIAFRVIEHDVGPQFRDVLGVWDDGSIRSLRLPKDLYDKIRTIATSTAERSK